MMNYSVSCVFFLVNTFAIIVALLSESQTTWMIASALVIPATIVLGVHFIVEKRFYTAILFCAHAAMYVFTVYVFLVRDRILQSPNFDFIVFTDENLQTGLLAIAITLAITTCTPLLWDRRCRGSRQVETFSLLSVVLGKAAAVNVATMWWLLLLSISGAIVSFAVNTTVLEVAYPYNGAGHWFPGFVLVAPESIGLVVLALAHARKLGLERNDRSFDTLLLAARINLVIVPCLCLLVLGQRGYTTFLWTMAIGVEVYSWRKRRAGVAWVLIYVIFAYFAYSAWPCLRADLATVPPGEAVINAVEHVLSLKEGQEVSELIDLNMYPMIGQSLFHLLYAIEMEKNDMSFGGSTFINLIPQALPGFLDGVLWERPLNDNWKIAYISGGGFFAIGNAYVNGGMWVMVLFVFCISALFLYFDLHTWKESTSTIYKFIYFMYIPLVIVQLFYGIQGLVRVPQALLLVMILEKLVARASFRGQQV